MKVQLPPENRDAIADALAEAAPLIESRVDVAPRSRAGANSRQRRARGR